MCFIRYFLIILLFAGCNSRERNNPLDPKNPLSEGKPAAPFITAIKDSVGVSWSHLRFTNATGFNLYRRLDGETAFQLIASLPSYIFAYWDTRCEYEKNRWYKISVSTGEFESLLSDAVQIRPGPTYLWIADASKGTVTKYSHDGRYRLFQVYGFTEPTNIAADTANNLIWVSDIWDHRIKRIDRGGTIINEAISLLGISDFAFDIEDDMVWATSFSADAVARFNLLGAKEVEISTFSMPGEILLNTEKNFAILASLAKGELIRLNYEGQILEQKSGFAPIGPMVYDQARDRLWLGRGQNLLLIENASDQLSITAEFSNFQFVSEIAIDPLTENLWVIDLDQSGSQSRIVKLSAAGEEILAVQSGQSPNSLAVNSYNSNCFYTEKLTGKIIELDGKTGTILGENSAGSFDAKMVVQILND